MSHKQTKRDRKTNPGPSKHELRRLQDEAMAKAVTVVQEQPLTAPRQKLTTHEARMLLAHLSGALRIR